MPVHGMCATIATVTAPAAGWTGSKLLRCHCTSHQAVPAAAWPGCHSKAWLCAQGPAAALKPAYTHG
jgi:hypothetical protein